MILKKNLIVTLFTLAPLFLFARAAHCDCFIVDGDRKLSFDGQSLSGLAVEKSSLISLDKEFPSLNVVEKTFTGDLQTCTNCSEKHVRCESLKRTIMGLRTNSGGLS